MTEISVFDFKAYKPFLTAALGGERKRTGLRSEAAKAIGCQPAYLSQVLNASADLSLEQALKAANFLKLGPDEKEMFLLLVQKERAGDRDLKTHFDDHIQALLQRRLSVQNRLKQKDALGAEDQSTYYSRWQYACLHVIVSIPHLRSREAIAEHLGLPTQEVSDILEFLETRGLVGRDSSGQYVIGPRHIHLSDQASNIQKHHTNWRLKALQSFERPARPDELHYSVVVTLSREDAMKIREQCLQLIQENMKRIQASPEEVVFCQVMDWFEIRK